MDSAEVLAITIPSEGSSFQPSDRNLSIKMMTTTKNKKMKNRNTKKMKMKIKNDLGYDVL